MVALYQMRIRSKLRAVWPVLAACLMVMVALTLFLFPPESSAWYPQCPFYAATGLLCPGCGGTRALAALLHGEWTNAFHANVLLVSLLPVAAVYCGAALVRSCAGYARIWLPASRVIIAGLIGVACGFAVLRNLP